MLKAYYQVSTSSKKGRKKLCRSFVRAFFDILYTRLGCGNHGSTDTSGVTRDSSYTILPPMFCSAPFGSHKTAIETNTYTSVLNGARYGTGSSFGIVVGSGTAAVTTIDDNLQTQIAHGTSTGTLKYLNHYIPNDVTTSGANVSYNIERLFLNASGGDVTVNEVALYAATVALLSGADYPVTYYCLIRDLVDPAVTVADGEYLKVMYTIQVTA